MRKPILILLVEQYRQTWAAACIGMGVVILFSLWRNAEMFKGMAYYQDPSMFTAAVWCLLCPVILFFLFMHEDMHGLQIGLPKRWKVLPLPTHTIVFAQGLHKVTSGFGLALCVVWITTRITGYDYPFNPYVICVTAVCALSVWGVALSFLISAHGPWKGTFFLLFCAVIAAIFVWLLGYPLRIFAHDTTIRAYSLMPWHGIPAWLALTGKACTVMTALCGCYLVYELGWFYGGLAAGVFAMPQIYYVYHANYSENAFSLALGVHFYALGILGYGVAWLGAAHARNAWPAAVVFYPIRIDAPLRAQIWFEWQQTTRWLPASAALLAALVAPFLWFATTGIIPVFFIPFLLWTTAFGAGYYLLRCSPAYLRFVAVRPISTSQLAYAKLIAGALAIAEAFVLVMLMDVLSVLAFPNTNSMEVAVLIAYQAGIILPSVWLVLFLGRAALISAAVLAVPYLSVVMLVGENSGAAAIVSLLEGIVVLLGIGCLGIMARKRGFLRRKHLFIAVPILLLACVASVNESMPDMLFFDHKGIAPLALLCLIPFLWVPLILHRQRHQ